MPIRETLANNEWYHVYNRGIDKKSIFHSEHDFDRFLTTIQKIKQDKLPNIKILAYALMPNHFHLIIKCSPPTPDSGVVPTPESKPSDISQFLYLLQMSYARYYQERYKDYHKGAVFGGRFKAKYVDSDEYLIALLHYVHRQASHHKVGVSHSGVPITPESKKGIDYDWPYSSLHDYLLRSSPMFRITDIDESLVDIQQYPKMFDAYTKDLEEAWTFE